MLFISYFAQGGRDMRGCLFHTLFFFAVATLVFGADHPERVIPLNPAKKGEFEKQPKIAVVVGVGAYPRESGFGQLHYSAKDAENIAAELGAQGYSVKLLVDSKANKNLLRQTLVGVAEMVDKNAGTVIFFFSGHGFEYKGSNYLATADSVVSDLGSSGLKVDDVEDLLKHSGAKRRILWLDACRNDPGTGAKGTGTARPFSRLSAAEGTRILYATKAGEVSYENELLQQGVFSHYLIRALKGEAAESDGLITFQDLASYVGGAVQSYSFGQGQTQVPYAAGEASDDFLVANVAKGISVVNDQNSKPSVPVLKQLRDQLTSLHVRAGVQSEFWGRIKAQNEKEGFGLRPSITLNLGEAKAKIQQTETEINDGEYDKAQQSMKDAQSAIEKLENIDKKPQ
jgi:hypothetical protein